MTKHYKKMISLRILKTFNFKQERLRMKKMKQKTYLRTEAELERGEGVVGVVGVGAVGVMGPHMDPTKQKKHRNNEIEKSEREEENHRTTKNNLRTCLWRNSYRNRGRVPRCSISNSNDTLSHS
jgi:hypothetical protein